jgi:5-methylcytosine-specific restriction endonuclease McrA
VQERSRYVSSSVQERRFECADYQCEYRGPDGVRCTARVGLEVDHIEPYAKGGSSGEENLRVLCKGHNLWCAAREFGEAFMRGKIEGREAEYEEVGRVKGEKERAVVGSRV